MIRKMNELVMEFRGKTFQTQLFIPIELCMSSKLLFKYVKTNPYFFVLMVNRSCYRKLLIPLCTFLNFHTHLVQNLARSFHNVFDKCSMVLNLIFRESNFSRKSPYFRIPFHLKAIKYYF